MSAFYILERLLKDEDFGKKNDFFLIFNDYFYDVFLSILPNGDLFDLLKLLFGDSIFRLMVISSFLLVQFFFVSSLSFDNYVDNF